MASLNIEGIKGLLLSQFCDGLNLEHLRYTAETSLVIENIHVGKSTWEEGELVIPFSVRLSFNEDAKSSNQPQPDPIE